MLHYKPRLSPWERLDLGFRMLTTGEFQNIQHTGLAKQYLTEHSALGSCLLLGARSSEG